MKIVFTFTDLVIIGFSLAGLALWGIGEIIDRIHRKERDKRDK